MFVSRKFDNLTRRSTARAGGGIRTIPGEDELLYEISVPFKDNY